MKKIYLLLPCLVALVITAEAQYSRYIIQLKDKTGTAFTIANPSAYLSAKALGRRSKQNISIDSTDLPVSASYIDSISSVPNVTILNKSNWLNLVCISTTDPSALVKINSFSFVTAASPIGARMIPSISRVSKILEELSVSSAQDQSSVAMANALNYGNTFNQIHIHNGEFLHNAGYTGAGITIAILDAGFSQYKTNPAFDSALLQNRILGEWDFVANELPTFSYI